ncbi:MAG: type II secretion system protein [Lentisphaeraceae bacterium]|nr:type II secretion system protein [Lentisphaeraceae bacterium]
MTHPFTLIEFLFAIAIVGILASMHLPSISKATNSVCISNLKQQCYFTVRTMTEKCRLLQRAMAPLLAIAIRSLLIFKLPNFPICQMTIRLRYQWNRFREFMAAQQRPKKFSPPEAVTAGTINLWATKGSSPSRHHRKFPAC